MQKSADLLNVLASAEDLGGIATQRWQKYNMIFRLMCARVRNQREQTVPVLRTFKLRHRRLFCQLLMPGVQTRPMPSVQPPPRWKASFVNGLTRRAPLDTSYRRHPVRNTWLGRCEYLTATHISCYRMKGRLLGRRYTFERAIVRRIVYNLLWGSMGTQS